MQLTLTPRIDCNWVLHIDTEATHLKYMLENIKTGFVDFPDITPEPGRHIVYDYPERIPAYVQKFISKCLIGKRTSKP